MLSTTLSLAQTNDIPGWFLGEAERVEPGMLASAVVPLFMPVGFTDSPNEIKELARGLEHDPLRIFDYVRNNVRYEPYFGLLKGAKQTLLDRSGNDFDQAELLTELLKTSGYSPVYGHGIMSIPLSDWISWMGAGNLWDAYDLTVGGGIPVGGPQGGSMLIDRVWVEVSVDGTLRRLDPAFKKHAITAASLSGITTANRVLSAAGGSTGPDWVQFLNKNTLFAELDTITGELLSSLYDNHFDSSVSEVLGGVKSYVRNMRRFPSHCRTMCRIRGRGLRFRNNFTTRFP